MKIIRNHEDLIFNNATAVALGAFDGLHVGHKKVIDEMIAVARGKNLETVVYTYFNHPKELITPDDIPEKIIELEEKIQLFSEFDIDILCLVDFNEDEHNRPAEEFISEFLFKDMKIRHLTVGHDYRFGAKALGNIDMIDEYSKKLGFSYQVISPVEVDGIRVSSTAIRACLVNGDIKMANRYLGRFHFVKGVVVEGKKCGTSLGFPTANLRIKKNMSTIKPGVYVSQTILEGKIYNSLTNVGFNPTFNQRSLNLETFILGIDKELYGFEIEVSFLERIRDELKFDNLDDLMEQMNGDLKIAIDYFSNL